MHEEHEQILSKRPIVKKLMQTRLKTSVLIVFVCLSLTIAAGCATNQETAEKPDIDNITIVNSDAELKSAETKLAEAASSVDASLRQLAEIERATHPQARLPSPPSAELIRMNQLASVQWTGPVAPLVDKIAQATHYKLRIIGKAPAIPILISISAKDTPMADILRDVTFQCGNKANIVLYAASRTIELRYAKT